MFLYLDSLLQHKLFRPDEKKQETRVTLAGEEAVKAKRCLGSLRNLWRNSRFASHCQQVQDMKDLLCASPIQRANSNLSLALQDAQPDEDLEPGADAEAASASFQGSDSWEASGDEGERIGDDEGGESGDEGAGSGDEGEEIGDEGEEIGDEIDGVPIEDFPHAHAFEEEQKASDSDADSLTAPTMQLGEHTSDEETSEDQRDSQVKGRWMGNFYRDYGKWGKSETSYKDDMVPKSVMDNDMVALLKDIENSFTTCGTIKFLV